MLRVSIDLLREKPRSRVRGDDAKLGKVTCKELLAGEVSEFDPNGPNGDRFLLPSAPLDKSLAIRSVSNLSKGARPALPGCPCNNVPISLVQVSGSSC